MSSADNYCYDILRLKRPPKSRFFECFFNLRIDGLKLIETSQGLFPFGSRFIANEIPPDHLNKALAD